MIANDILNVIMNKFRISNVLLSELTNIHVTTICRYRNKQRNIGRKNINKIYDALTELKVNDKTIEELRQSYENPGFK